MFAYTFGLHITWTTYGSRLPGDERGHVSNIRKPEGGFERVPKAVGAPLGRPDPHTHQLALAAQSFPTILLTREHARWAAEELVRVAAKQDWLILRAAVMENHIHVVVVGCPDDGPAVRRRLKGVVQSGLNKRFGKPMKWWTEGGSDRYKHDAEAIGAAVNYVTNQPGMLAGVGNNCAFAVGEKGDEQFLE